VWYAIITLTLLTAAEPSAQVTATKLEGASAVGTLASWTDGRCVLATSSGQQQLPESQLLSLRWKPAQPPAAASQPVVTLVDGSILPVDGYKTSGGSAHLVIHNSGPPDQRTVDLPVDQVRAAWLQSIDEKLSIQRDEIRALNLPSDLLVVFKQNGKSLDYVEGVVGQVTDADVEFTLDNKPLRVQRSKVAGIVYYRGDQNAQVSGPCVLVGRDGLRANAAQLQLTEDQIHFVTAGQIHLAWPLADLEMADFSAGKLVFLSDLEPAAEHWSPWVGLPAGAALAAKYGQPRRDESAYGGPLTLSFPAETPAESGHEQTFDKGLSLRSRTELSYRLPRGFSRFMAVAGIEPATTRSGDVQLSIQGDGRPLWEGHLAGDRPPQALDLNIDGVKKLTIVVDYGDNLDTGDWLNLCNARIVK
jgi:NPCBM/NEW2 domain